MSKQLLLEGFEEKFCDNGPIGEYDSIKNFLSKAIDQTREETIKEILSELRLKLRNTYKEEEFWGKFGSTKTINTIKQFININPQAIDQTREETIESIVKYIRENLTAEESWERGDIYININNVETLGSGSFNWDNEFWDELKNNLLNNLK